MIQNAKRQWAGRGMAPADIAKSEQIMRANYAGAGR
jgi:hypothetical protein